MRSSSFLISPVPVPNSGCSAMSVVAADQVIRRTAELVSARSSTRSLNAACQASSSRLLAYGDSSTSATNPAVLFQNVGATIVSGEEIEEIYDRDVIDSAERVSDEESFAMVKRLVREEGLLVGGSAGTNVVAALRVAARADVDGPVVTVLPDSWDRYRAQPWMCDIVAS